MKCNANSCGAPDIEVLARHNHKDCVRDIEKAIEAKADDRLNLTPARRRVLEILMESHHAKGAYVILETLRAEGAAFQPPIVYRALDYLIENGLVHRIEKLNAFVACSSPSHNHAPGFLVCENCNLVAEHHLTEAPNRISKPALEHGFQISNVVSEVFGLCKSCSEKEVSK